MKRPLLLVLVAAVTVGLVVFFTRFMLTPLALPTNLIAGSSRYGYAQFLALDALGELIWVCLYLGLGYSFAAKWETIGDLAGSLSGVLVGLTSVGVAVGLAYRAWRRRTTAAAVAGAQLPPLR